MPLLDLFSSFLLILYLGKNNLISKQTPQMVLYPATIMPKIDEHIYHIITVSYENL